jgi:hypothetical protein
MAASAPRERPNEAAMAAATPREGPNEAGAIYGQILVTAVVASLTEQPTISAGEAFFTVAVTMLLFWLAHVYADGVVKRLRRVEPLRLREVWAIGKQQWPIAQAAVPALLALGAGSVGLLSRDTAVGAAIALGVAQLFAWGFVIARRSRMSPLGTVGAVALNGAFGLAIVALKVIVH